MSEARGRNGKRSSQRGLRSFTHHALYRDEAARERRCDVCDATVSAKDDDGAMPTGAGLYVWTRGDEVRYEERPLCAACGAALGMAQVRRWEIEDDEEG
jgi:hypothetical protein